MWYFTFIFELRPWRCLNNCKCFQASNQIHITMFNSAETVKFKIIFMDLDISTITTDFVELCSRLSSRIYVEGGGKKIFRRQNAWTTKYGLKHRWKYVNSFFAAHLYKALSAFDAMIKFIFITFHIILMILVLFLCCSKSLTARQSHQ